MHRQLNPDPFHDSDELEQAALAAIHDPTLADDAVLEEQNRQYEASCASTGVPGDRDDIDAAQDAAEDEARPEDAHLDVASAAVHREQQDAASAETTPDPIKAAVEAILQDGQPFQHLGNLEPEEVRPRLCEEFARLRAVAVAANADLDGILEPWREEVVEARLALEETPEWKRLQEAEAAAYKAGEAEAERLGISRLLARTENAKTALVTLHRDMVEHDPDLAKTIDTPHGRVTHRVTAGIHIHSHEELARDLLERRLFVAAGAELKVKAAFVHPLLKGKDALRGAVQKDSVSVSWTPPKEA